MSKVKSYLSLIKFSHTIFAMPFALIGFFLALFPNKIEPDVEHFVFIEHKMVDWGWDKVVSFWWEIVCQKLILVILCMVFARSAAMAFNRYLDRSFDAKNQCFVFHNY